MTLAARPVVPGTRFAERLERAVAATGSAGIDALFIGVGAGLLAWALTRRTLANPQLWVFASFPMMVAAQTVQWSPYLTAAALITRRAWYGVVTIWKKPLPGPPACASA